MNITMIALWALGGWCGTPWPGWWRGPRPHPDPEPWITVQVIGLAGGIAGGWMTSQIVQWPDPVPWRLTPDYFTVTMIGALVASRLLTGVYGLIRDRASASKGQ
ncbi:MAG TPA: hypothetical protein VJH03_01615 [Blastocatellia bacterium]|nr:hypothetical protein [Blastocatellia bacterium]